MNNLKVIINGSIVNATDATLKINDLSIERGYGIFDFFKTVEGKPKFWEDNFDRFYSSAEAMRLQVGYSREELEGMIQKLMAVNKLPNSGIKILLTGGYSPDGYSIIRPNLIITQHGLKRNKELEKKGIKLVTYEHHRQLATVKTIDYLMGILTVPYAKERAAADVLYKKNGLISECPRANIFIVTKDNRLLTPGEDVLKGITRKYVLEIAKVKLTTEVKNITLEEVYNAKEAFITSTTKNITPVLSIDNIVYGSEPGVVTQQLQLQLEELIYR
jgi:D-alanine transaminase/branched-chain amino acid aminotransferase